MIGGALLALIAAHIFYLQPWLGISTPIDGWIARQSCLIHSLCTESWPLPHHLGLLAAVGALALFVAALWRPGDGAVEAEAMSRRGGSSGLHCWPCSAWAASGLLAYQTLSADQSPSPTLWMIGIGAPAIAALIWDAQEPQILAQTVAGLLVAVGIAALLIGLGVALAQPVTALWLLLPGALLVVGGAAWSRHAGRILDPVDLAMMLALGAVALLLGASRIGSWRYAFVGDEWGFFDLATTLIHRPELHTLFSVVDANAYHTVFSSALQAKIMQLAGENVYGWRLSSLLPMVLSVPAVYVFARWLSGRTAAIVAAGLLASSHMLLSFSMVAYNNTQALLPLTFGLALFAYAERRQSAVRYYALGAVLGSSFLLFGLARLVVLPIGILVIFFCWATWRRALLSILSIGAGALAVATPLLFNLENWRGLLKATPIQSEVAGVSEAGSQMVRNLVGGALAFLANSHNTHFVVGPHVDPLTALLLLVGLAATIAGWHRRRLAAWLVASLLCWASVSAIQQYAWVSTTRMFVLVPVYTIYAGLGAAVLGRHFFGDSRRQRLLWAGGIVAAGILINQFHIVRVADAQNPMPVEALLVREFQRSTAADGAGMPIYVVWDQPYTVRENMILNAYGFDSSRIRFLTPDEALSIAALCEDQRAQMLLIHPRVPQLAALRDRVDACWPVHEEMDLLGENGEIRLHRFMTEAGVHAAIEAGDRSWIPPMPARLVVDDPVDLVVDGADHLFVLSKQPPSIRRFDEQGRQISRLDLSQGQPTAMALTPDGLLLVSHGGKDPALIWLDGRGQVVKRLSTNGVLVAPTGLAVLDSGEILVADAALGQVLRLSPNGALLTVHTGSGQLNQPVAVTAVEDGSFWTLDSVNGQWLKIASDDELLSTLSTDRASPSSPPRLVVADDGSLIFTEPDRQRILHVDSDGRLLDLWGGRQRPSAIAAGSQNRLFVMDEQLDQVAVAATSGADFGQERAVVLADAGQSGLGPYAGTAESPFFSPVSPLLSHPDLMTGSAVTSQTYLPLAQSAGLSRPRAVSVGVDPNQRRATGLCGRRGGPRSGDSLGHGAGHRRCGPGVSRAGRSLRHCRGRRRPTLRTRFTGRPTAPIRGRRDLSLVTGRRT